MFLVQKALCSLPKGKWKDQTIYKPSNPHCCLASKITKWNNGTKLVGETNQCGWRNVLEMELVPIIFGGLRNWDETVHEPKRKSNATIQMRQYNDSSIDILLFWRHFSAMGTEASSCSRVGNPQTDNMRRMRDCRKFNLSGMPPLNLSLQGSDNRGKERERLKEPEAMEGTKETKPFKPSGSNPSFNSSQSPRQKAQGLHRPVPARIPELKEENKCPHP